MKKAGKITKVSMSNAGTTISIEPTPIPNAHDKFSLVFHKDHATTRTMVSVDKESIELLEAVIKMYKVHNNK